MSIGDRPIFYHGVAFNRPPNDRVMSPIWSDVTSKVTAFSPVTRGRQYELAESMSTSPTIAFLDPNEDLNPENPSGPYAGRVKPLRELVTLAQWNAASWAASGVNAATGNLMNLATWENPSDTSFESYPLGTNEVYWMGSALGGPDVGVSVSTGTAWQGNQKVQWTVDTVDSLPFGAWWSVACIPGVQYTCSAYVRQSAANTQLISVEDQLLIADDFVTPVVNGLGTAQLGGAWILQGGVSSQYQVAGGVATLDPVAGAGVDLVGVINAATAQQDVYARLKGLGDPLGGERGYGVLGRRSNVNNLYQGQVNITSTGEIELLLWEVLAGVYTELARFPLAVDHSTDLTMHLQCQGSHIRLNIWPDGSDEPTEWMVDVTPATVQTGTSAGIWAWRASADASDFQFSDFQVNGQVAGTTTAATGAYNRVSVTWTATQPAHRIQLATRGARLAGTVFVDGVQHEQGSAASAWSIDGPVIYPVQRPMVERWPREWTAAGFRGWCVAPGIDGMGALARITLDPEYVNAVRATNPLYYWRLNDGSDATAFLSDTQLAPAVSLYPFESKYGAGEGISPGAALAIPGNPGGTGVRFHPDPAPASAQTVAATILGAGNLASQSPNRPAIAFPPFFGSEWSVTISCWVIGEPSGLDAWIAGPQRQGNTRSWVPVALFATSAGQVYAGCQAATTSGGVLVSTYPADVILDGTPRFLTAVVTQDAANTTIWMYVDGALVDSNTDTTANMGGSWTTDKAQANNMLVGGSLSRRFSSQIFDGVVSDVTLHNRALSADEIETLYLAGILAGYGETPGARTVRHLAAAGYTGETDIDEVSNTTMQAPSHSGSVRLLADLQQNVGAEDGCTWVNADGTLVFEGRAQRWARRTPDWVFGEDESLGEHPYRGSLLFDTDPTFVFPDVRVTRPNGATALGGTSNDRAQAGREYFPLSYTPTFDLADDDQTQDRADWAFNTHKAAMLRVAVIELDPAANPALWPVVFAVENGRRIQVVRRAKAANAGAGLTMRYDFFVEQVSHEDVDMATWSWKTRLLASPIGAPGTVPNLQPWVLEDPVYGVLNSTTILGF